MAPYLKGATVALLAAAVAFGVLFGGAAGFSYTAQDAPLKAALRRVKGVQAVALHRRGPKGGLEAQVTLRPSADLATTYVTLEEMVRRRDPRGSVRIEDHPDPRLDQAARAEAFPIEEGIATGRFTAMRRAVLETARQAGVTAVVEMDGGTIYLKLLAGSHDRMLVYPWKEAPQ